MPLEIEINKSNRKCFRGDLNCKLQYRSSYNLESHLSDNCSEKCMIAESSHFNDFLCLMF